MSMYKRLFYRFLRGGIASAFASMCLIIPTQIGSLSDVYTWLNALMLAGIVGFITGALLAGDKFLRDTTQTK